MQLPVALQLDADTPQYQGLRATGKGPCYQFYFRFTTHRVTADGIQPLDEPLRLLVYVSLGAFSSLSCAVGEPQLRDQDALRLAPHVFDAVRALLVARGTLDVAEQDEYGQPMLFMTEREFPAGYRPRAKREIAMRQAFLVGGTPGSARIGFHAQ